MRKDNSEGATKEPVSYILSADGVLAVGTYTSQLQPKEGPPQQMTACWTDFRRKHEGNWVIVYEHTHALPSAGQ